MSNRPYGLLAMGRHARETAFPTKVEAALTRIAEVDLDMLVTDFGQPRQALNRADFMITSWGCAAVTEEVLEAAPNLRLIAHAAGSVKGHLSDSVWRRDIEVSSAAMANAEPVAEYTRAMIMLACKRILPRAALYQSAGPPSDAERAGGGYIGRTIGVVGASLIGRRVLELLRDSYNMELLLHDPFLGEAEAVELGAKLTGLDELCERADVVTVHAPELPETRHLIDEQRLSAMRDGATLINTARGSLVDTEALNRHCGAGRLDAILDVTDPEPLPRDHPLLRLPNVTVTPHLAGAQGSEIAELGRFAVSEVARFFAGERLRGRVRPEALSRMA